MVTSLSPIADLAIFLRRRSLSDRFSENLEEVRANGENGPPASVDGDPV